LLLFIIQVIRFFKILTALLQHPIAPETSLPSLQNQDFFEKTKTPQPIQPPQPNAIKSILQSEQFKRILKGE
jgi:hypothetical protein